MRVPVFVSHGEAIFVETEKIIDLETTDKIKNTKGLSLVDKRIGGGYVTPDESGRQCIYKQD